MIYPYIDLKHLRTLDIYAYGYNIIDIDSTALQDLKSLIEYEVDQGYSQSPNFYYIYNIDTKGIKEIMEIERSDKVRCVINTNAREIPKEILEAADSKFIFYNKKQNHFLNLNGEAKDLGFERDLISGSNDIDILADSLQRIKSLGTRIFKHLNETGKLTDISSILGKYKPEYWPKILKYTSLFYDLVIPEIPLNESRDSQTTSSKSTSRKDFSEEYDVIVGKKSISKEFINLLCNYRNEQVNQQNLDLSEIYEPKKFYNYLRNHHWKSGIPEDKFLFKWVDILKSKKTPVLGYEMDLREVFEQLHLPTTAIDYFLSEDEESQDDDLDVKNPLPIEALTLPKSVISKPKDIGSEENEGRMEKRINEIIDQVNEYLDAIMRAIDKLPDIEHH